jgi:hypothetical protein
MRLIAVIALGAAVAGCSTIDPSPKLKAANDAIAAAKAAGAESIPAANDLLAQATKYLGTAQTQIKNGDMSTAIRNLNNASAAAGAAKVTATEATQRARADQLSAQIADLKAKLGK